MSEHKDQRSLKATRAIGIGSGCLAAIGAFLTGMKHLEEGDSKVWMIIAFCSSTMLAFIAFHFLNSPK